MLSVVICFLPYIINFEPIFKDKQKIIRDINFLGSTSFSRKIKSYRGIIIYWSSLKLLYMVQIYLLKI